MIESIYEDGTTWLQHRQLVWRRSRREGLVDARELFGAEPQLAAGGVGERVVAAGGFGNREYARAPRDEGEHDCARRGVVLARDLLEDTAAAVKPRQLPVAERR